MDQTIGNPGLDIAQRMKVVLISPYSNIEATGLRILSACLKRLGFPTQMLFLPDLDEAMAHHHYDQRRINESIFQQVIELCDDAGMVGITVMTPSFGVARDITEALHSSLSVPVIWGGIHPTLRPEECLRYADLVCMGEGEQSIVEVAQFLERGQEVRGIPNLAYLDDAGGMCINPARPLESDLDQLPTPDYDYDDHYVLLH